jgi:hypothetical protein
VDTALTSVATWIAESDLRRIVIELLRDVPGLPPLVQAVHILGIAVVIGVFVIPQMKVLGIAANGQSYPEMLLRLRPWRGWALTTLLLTGAVFVIARPFRYLFNPMVGIKFACLAVALALTVWVQHRAASAAPDFGPSHRMMAALAVVAWIGVILSGRWIAYVDYLFWEA